ncbi:MAG: TonB C-terminal domain-containing protein [Zoogloeaceae bacterium]|jgi:colicin import membrane protein|nr:TonB C-terminal domain-containing protein [Zoogloeaceae bacterium]
MLHEANREPGRKKALAITIAVHLLLVLALFFGVQWKTEHAAVEVELWSPTYRAAASPPPAVAPPPVEPQQVRQPPKPEPEPRVEAPKPEKKPDIVQPDKKEEKKKEEKKPPREKKEDFRDLLEQDLKTTRQERDERLAQLRMQAGEEVQRSAGRKVAESNWLGKIKDKVRGNIILPLNIIGNPRAVFSVNLLPTGEVLGSPRIMRSSGNSALDEAIMRAILKSSPLPKPDDPSVFQRNLEITYCPYENTSCE